MPIVGFASTLFGVEDVAKCTQFFEDLGLPLFEKNGREVLLQAGRWLEPLVA